MTFPYGETEIEYLKKRDARLGEVIDRVGFISREVDDDIFASIVKNIAGQQISNAALKTVLVRLTEACGELTPENVCAAGVERLRACGMSLRKTENIFDIAQKVCSGEIDLEILRSLSDDEIIARLTDFGGIGTWTAEMLLIFTFLRPNVLSFGDFGIRRGIELLYGEEKLTRKKFNEYREHYSPYATVAGFYLWALANGEVTI